MSQITRKAAGLMYSAGSRYRFKAEPLAEAEIDRLRGKPESAEHHLALCNSCRSAQREQRPEIKRLVCFGTGGLSFRASAAIQ